MGDGRKSRLSGQRRSSRGFGVIAGALATVWIGVGLLAIAIGLAQGRWLPPLCGVVAVWYGLVWMRAAREGRLLRWPQGLLPWRRP
jgi:predicted acyltransferase